jgi:2-dehydropantoate 2-reductase
MSQILVAGAGIIGGYMAARLLDNGADISLLARGEKADRLDKTGLELRDGLTGEERTVRLPIVREPVENHYEIVMVCVQDSHRSAVEDLIQNLPGRPIIWFLGNTSRGYENAGNLLGRDRILGGFPDFGGTWDQNVLVYADREKPKDKPFNKLIASEAFPESKPAFHLLEERMSGFNQRIIRFDPIIAWHWCHLALILPLTGAFYLRNGDLEAVASDRMLLKMTMRATVQGLDIVRQNGYPVLPKGLKMFRFMPSTLGAMKLARLLRSRFGEIALAGHASTARNEMQHLAKDMLGLAGQKGKREFTELLGSI